MKPLDIFNDISNNSSELICAYDTQFEFHLDYKYIISRKEYYERIKQKSFKKYLDDRICIEENSKKSYDGQNHRIIYDYNFKKDIKCIFLAKNLHLLFIIFFIIYWNINWNIYWKKNLE